MDKLLVFMEGQIGRGLRVALGMCLVYIGIGRIGGVSGGILAIAGVLPIAMGLWGPCLLRLALRAFKRPLVRHSPGTEKDAVCGMDVAADAPLRFEHAGNTYVFCSESCRRRFKDNPKAYVGGADQPRAGAPVTASR